MTSADLEQYLHQHIPMSLAMGVRVANSSTDSIILAAPLGPNINHHRTAFGGSISTLATLACWSFTHTLLGEQGMQAALVIQRHEIDYLKPITGDFCAETLPVDPDSISSFFDRLSRKGKGRLEVKAVVRFNGEVCATFAGQFVAIAASGEE